MRVEDIRACKNSERRGLPVGLIDDFANYLSRPS